MQGGQVHLKNSAGQRVKPCNFQNKKKFTKYSSVTTCHRKMSTANISQFSQLLLDHIY